MSIAEISWRSVATGRRCIPPPAGHGYRELASAGRSPGHPAAEDLRRRTPEGSCGWDPSVGSGGPRAGTPEEIVDLGPSRGA
jgi:hypothetical protein